MCTQLELKTLERQHAELSISLISIKGSMHASFHLVAKKSYFYYGLLFIKMKGLFCLVVF